MLAQFHTGEPLNLDQKIKRSEEVSGFVGHLQRNHGRPAARPCDSHIYKSHGSNAFFVNLPLNTLSQLSLKQKLDEIGRLQ